MFGQVFFTVFSGVAVFVIGQLFVKFAIDPIHEYRKLCGEIADALIYFANVNIRYFGISPEELDRAHSSYRQLAGRLLAKAHVIRWYPFWAWLHLVQKRKDLAEASQNLIGLSNNVFDQAQDASCAKDEYRRNIKHLLDLETGE